VEEDGVIWHVCRVKIASPTQLRTGIYNPEKPKSNRTDRLSTMAKRYNAVIAINGDYYSKDPGKTTFEIRQTTVIRANTNRYKDVMIIDEQGDFHFIAANPELSSKKYAAWFQDQISAFTAEHEIINAFTFGPILVHDGVVDQSLYDKKIVRYTDEDPRMAMGCIEPCHYVILSIKGRTSDSNGAPMHWIAERMRSLGCQNALNLDGGGTTALYFMGDVLNKVENSQNLRDLSSMFGFSAE
jgi:exopolysaccharide biosynthesis protein